MDQEEQKQLNKEVQTLIFFQNLVPGKQDSSLIQEFKMQCLDKENDPKIKQYREQLLNNNPPILTFRQKKEEGDFYNQQAKDCSSFCCGGTVAINPFSPHPIEIKDSYMFSAGTGELFKGSAQNIQSQLKGVISSETFGSAKQMQYVNGFNEFNNSVLTREATNSVSEFSPKNETTSSSPFKTTPKPDNL